MTTARRRRLPDAPREPEPCTVCGMPSTSHWRARAADDIYLCDRDLPNYEHALKKAEYRKA